MIKIDNTIKVLIFGIVVGIVIVLVILIGLYNADAINFGSNKCDVDSIAKEKYTTKEKNEYSYEKLEGLYSYKKDSSNEELDKIVYNLYLYKNGTYVYSLSDDNKVGEIGNYIIKDSNIRLNSLFAFNSDGGIYSNFEGKLLTIMNSTQLKVNDIIFYKNNKDEKDFLENNNFIDVIDKRSITNKYDSMNMLK
ncbi:MAG: hypothetical protein VZS44_02980 [Bacilli bacterium]|nr:hypothetical protein [Bacilli bacterium]